MNIKDYLHLYLRCDCITEYHHCTSYDESWVYRGEHKLNVSMLNDFDGVESKIKLLLRPLSDMTEEEFEHFEHLTHLHPAYDEDGVWEMSGELMNNTTPEACRYALTHGFDLFGLIDAGLAIDKSKIVTNGKAGDLEVSNG